MSKVIYWKGSTVKQSWLSRLLIRLAQWFDGVQFCASCDAFHRRGQVFNEEVP